MATRQVGFAINHGPVYVSPVGDKFLILQSEYEPIDGKMVWTTRVKGTVYANVLSADGGDKFPYSEDQCTIGDYEGQDLVNVDSQSYKIPNFGTKTYKGTYQNIASDWIDTTFQGKVIRNKSEYTSAGGNGTVKTPTLSTAGTGSGAKSNTTLYVFLGLIALVVIVLLVTRK